MNRMDQVSKITLFQDLNEKQLSRLAKHIRLKIYRKGDLLFSEGQKAQDLYFVFKGQVKIFKLSSDGKEQILRIVKARETFAEVPIFEGANFPAYCQAIKESEVGLLSREVMMSLIQEDSELAMRLLAILSKRLRQLTELLEGLTLKESLSRFAVYLLALDKQHGSMQQIELDISKTTLASLLGTSRENLSRIMMRLAREGVISVNKRMIMLLDRKKLYRYSIFSKEEGGKK